MRAGLAPNQLFPKPQIKQAALVRQGRVGRAAPRRIWRGKEQSCLRLAQLGGEQERGEDAIGTLSARLQQEFIC